MDGPQKPLIDIVPHCENPSLGSPLNGLTKSTKTKIPSGLFRDNRQPLSDWTFGTNPFSNPGADTDAARRVGCSRMAFVLSTVFASALSPLSGLGICATASSAFHLDGVLLESSPSAVVRLLVRS
ncbi:hypothetical protein M569_00073 [Genlisea aurea]|uniref:Uncharacterized protein n=1 Tax=Genlisea aurea TaxID=192259 RepID=S8EF92_9LAMI|nr:hypothetical protein M569_00073 [Genlisea aurea]